MITRVKIEHYKSMESIDLDLGKFVVLVGRNATGKSNFVDALSLVRDAARFGLDRAVAERHGIDSIRQWSPRTPYQVSFRIDVVDDDFLEEGKGFLSFTLASNRGSHTVRREEAQWQSDPDGKIFHYKRDADGKVNLLSGSGPSQELVADQSEELFLRHRKAREFHELASVIADFEAYTIYPNVLRSPQKASSDKRLAPNGRNFASIYKRLTQSKAKVQANARREILSSMKEIMPTMESIRVRSGSGLMWPEFRIREENDMVHDFNVSQVSDGTLRVLGILTAIYHPSRPAVIALEEPEQTIHPGVLSLLADVFEDVSRETQLIVTTHSPEFLDSLSDPGAVLAVDMQDGVTTIGPIGKVQREAVIDRLFSLGEIMTAEGLHQ